MPSQPSFRSLDSPAATRVDVIVIGAGIAGLATAHFLGRRGLSVTVIERAHAPFLGASGRNAAIFRHAEPSRLLVELVRESATLLDELVGDTPWKDRRGAVYLSTNPASLGDMRTALEVVGIAHELLQGDALSACAPDIEARNATGLFVPDDGVIDLDVVRARLLGGSESARTHAPKLILGTAVTEIVASRPACVVLESGQLIAADVVVVAAGAHSHALTALPFTPMRRHLVEMSGGIASHDHPIIWRLDDEVYYRPGPRTVVASPCDEVLCAPDDDDVRQHAIALTADKLSSLLSQPPTLSRAWACLRTWAPDRLPVAGALPGASGVFVIGGFGGFGMSAGVAVAAHAARAIVDGVEHPELTPSRFGRTLVAPSP
jgi:D-arginine dehydrogenase